MPWVELAVILVLGAALAWAALVAHTAWGLMHPPRRGAAHAISRGLPTIPAEVPPAWGGPFVHREWRLGRDGVDLVVWEVDGLAPDGPVVVWSHGWGESRVHALARLEGLVRGANRVVMYDARGHGESGGRCALGTIEVEDLLAVARAADAGRVVLAGFSMGAGVSIAAAAQAGDVPVVGVIAEAPYRLPGTPATRVLTKIGLGWWWTLRPALALVGVCSGRPMAWARAGRGGFDRAVFASEARVPMLVLHGEEDAIVPVADGEAIARAAGSECELVRIPGGGHTDLWLGGASRAACVEAVAAFVGRAGSGGRGR